VDKVMLIPSAALGLIFVIIYVWRCWKTGTEFNLAVMINTVFHASGIICGLFLIVSVFVPEAKEMISGIDIYVFVSGLAVFAVSAQSFHRDAIRSTGDCDSDAVDNSRIAQEESI
jgi:ABC-type uncharacterized transport system permease subunit